MDWLALRQLLVRLVLERHQIHFHPLAPSPHDQQGKVAMPYSDQPFGSLAPPDQLVGPPRNPAQPPDIVMQFLKHTIEKAGVSRDALTGKAAEYGLWLAARKGLLGAAAANIADPLAWGATALTAPVWGATEANAGERPFYKFDRESGKYIPADK
jgi:hypothetical protein